MTLQVLPTRIGQIVRTIAPHEGEDLMTDYLLCEDPLVCGSDESMKVYKVSEILRKSAIGSEPTPDHIPKKNLTVIAESLESWVESWNGDS